MTAENEGAGVRMHTVTVTKIEEDDIDWESTCDGRCNLWMECTKCQPLDGDSPDTIDEVERHGVTHAFREGYWAADVDGCALGHFDSAQDNVGWALQEIDGLLVGATFTADLDYEGDGDFDVSLTPLSTPGEVL